MKSLLVGEASISTTTADALATVARIGIGLSIAFAHGLGKIPPVEGFVSAVGNLGFPLPIVFAWAAALAELLGGLLLAAGLLTRPAAFFILVTMGVAVFMVHGNDGFAQQELAALYGFGVLIFLGLGGGRFSIDAILRKS